MLATTRIVFNVPPETVYVPVNRSLAHTPLLKTRYVPNALPASALSNIEPVYRTRRASRGSFIAGVADCRAGRRSYKLYIPSIYRGQSLPLIVMLHGCTQDPDDFALGTGMNRLAEERGFFVLYPAQSEGANHSRCWNWFSASDQQRDRGEPSILADATREIAGMYHVDGSRIYVAGHSAGASMAAILAKTYPDLFAAVGIHSGMPYASVRSAFFALHAMKYGAIDHMDISTGDATTMQLPVPAIVFHGDMDDTIHPQNGEKVILAKGLQSLAKADEHTELIAPVSVRNEPASAENYGHTVTRCRNELGRSLWEHWVIHGAGHNWSGGNPEGSYTDGRGPDASREMVRFFLDRIDSRLPHL
ncbi:MAG TPA: PHB depolymerase family esterase [Noviherbaspirillum sp.]|nr:PHB depolymerase family esterase [Noviherbaspirillum sp.]